MQNKITVTFTVNAAPGELHKLDIKFSPPPRTPSQRRAADQVIDRLKDIFREVAE